MYLSNEWSWMILLLNRCFLIMVWTGTVRNNLMWNLYMNIAFSSLCSQVLPCILYMIRYLCILAFLVAFVTCNLIYPTSSCDLLFKKWTFVSFKKRLKLNQVGQDMIHLCNWSLWNCFSFNANNSVIFIFRLES